MGKLGKRAKWVGLLAFGIAVGGYVYHRIAKTLSDDTEPLESSKDNQVTPSGLRQSLLKAFSCSSSGAEVDYDKDGFANLPIDEELYDDFDSLLDDEEEMFDEGLDEEDDDEEESEDGTPLSDEAVKALLTPEGGSDCSEEINLFEKSDNFDNSFDDTLFVAKVGSSRASISNMIRARDFCGTYDNVDLDKLPNGELLDVYNLVVS